MMLHAHIIHADQIGALARAKIDCSHVSSQCSRYENSSAVRSEMIDGRPSTTAGQHLRGLPSEIERISRHRISICVDVFSDVP